MKRGAGFLALFTVLFTGLHLASGPATLKSSVEVKAADRPSVEPQAPLRVDAGCEAFENTATTESQRGSTESAPAQSGEIATLMDRFLFGSSLRSHLAPGSLPKGMLLMVITLPDPIHTHLSLQFDRTLEALQQAAQDEHYTYDSSWLPWQVKNTEYTSVADRNAEAKETALREACPGVILFRKNMSALKPDNCAGEPTGTLRPGDVPFACGMLVFVVAGEAHRGAEPGAMGQCPALDGRVRE